MHAVLHLRTWVGFYWENSCLSLLSEQPSGTWVTETTLLLHPSPQWMCHVPPHLFYSCSGLVNSSGERELPDCVTFSACRAKWLTQKEPKTVHTNQFCLIHCCLLTCMKGFYLGWRFFHILCNNCENCQQEYRKINWWAHPGGFGCWWMHIWKMSPVLMVGSQYLHCSCF